MSKQHRYSLHTTWTGNKGTGTSDYHAYGREYTIAISGKPDIHGSSDTAFRGDASRHNPEDMLVSAISSCHMLWFLHLCADAGIIVTAYTDQATGLMEEIDGGGGRFAEVTLHPVATITDASKKDEANALHKTARERCFISNSCNFPIYHQPVVVVAE